MLKSLLLVSACALALVTSPASAALVFSDSTPGYSGFLVTKTGEYEIAAYGGAVGLNVDANGVSHPESYGLGLSGDFYLSAGEFLNIFVGGSYPGYGEDSTVNLAGAALLDAPAGGYSYYGYYGFNAGTNQDQSGLPGPAYLPPQYIVDESPYLNDEQNNPYGYDGPFVVIGTSPPGLVEIAAVPEPSTWTMMLVGFGIVGFAVRARRQKVSVTYA